MANSFSYKEKQYRVGDSLKVTYQIREGEKTRNQTFAGILLQVKGNTAATRTVTLRKLTKFGIGVERIIPLSSPFIVGMEPVKQTSYTKAKLYFVRNLSEQKLKHKIYKRK